MDHLGGKAMYIGPEEVGLGKRESVPDVARVLSRYVDAIMIRTFGHERVAELARYATVPVINGLSDLEHPCQALADLLTIREHRGALAGGHERARQADTRRHVRRRCGHEDRHRVPDRGGAGAGAVRSDLLCHLVGFGIAGGECGRRSRVEDPWGQAGLNRVGGGVTSAVLPHHRTYGSVYGGS